MCTVVTKGESTCTIYLNLLYVLKCVHVTHVHKLYTVCGYSSSRNHDHIVMYMIYMYMQYPVQSSGCHVDTCIVYSLAYTSAVFSVKVMFSDTLLFGYHFFCQLVAYLCMYNVLYENVCTIINYMLFFTHVLVNGGTKISKFSLLF